MRTPLEALEGRQFDVAIIGGGINGAAAAQHIVAQGHRVLVVDKGDFGSGSSSRSTRLLHCGLRYLAPGRSIWDFIWHPSRFLTALKMAKQAMEARAEFIATSSARAREMQFAFPIYRGGPYRGWQVDIAFLILKLLGPRNPPLDYRRVPAADVASMPLANELRDRDTLQSVAVYREYEFDWPERVCMDCILDAERMGAVVRNYTRAAMGPRREDGDWTIQLTDEKDHTTASITATVVINLAGIWIDDVNATATPAATRRVLGTKGAHIVVKLPDAYRGHGVATLNSKNEPFYCIPWNDLHFFGPTETIYEADKDDIHVTAEEQDWILGEANRLMPGIRIGAGDVRLTWAGVRPLTFDKALPFGNRSRQVHDLTSDGLPNVLALTGGPVMTHRSAGRMLAAEVARRVKPRNAPQRPSFDAKTAPVNDNSPCLIDGDTCVRLSDLQHGITHEHATNLMDLLFRRTGLGWRHRFSEEEIERALAVLASELRLSPDQREQERQAFTREYEQLFGNRQ